MTYLHTMFKFMDRMPLNNGGSSYFWPLQFLGEIMEVANRRKTHKII